MEPKVNEFWVTRLGAICLVVKVQFSPNISHPALLCYSPFTDEWVVSEMDRSLVRKATIKEITEFMFKMLETNDT